MLSTMGRVENKTDLILALTDFRISEKDRYYTVCVLIGLHNE
jgi:hypothetical protein